MKQDKKLTVILVLSVSLAISLGAASAQTSDGSGGGLKIQDVPVPDDGTESVSDAGAQHKFDAGFYQKIQDLIESDGAGLQDPSQKTDPEGPRGTSDEHDGGGYYDVIIVVGRDGADPDETARQNKDAMVRYLDSLGARNIAAAESLSFVTASIPVSEIPGLSLREEIRQMGDGEMTLTAQVDRARRNIHATPSDLQRSIGWAPNGTGVTVAVIDTGINNTRMNFKIADQVDCGRLGCYRPWNTIVPSIAHGTQVAQVLAASGLSSNNGIAPGVAILDVKIPAYGVGGAFSMAHGVDWSYSNGADVISLSYGRLAYCSDSHTRSYRMIINEVIDKGVVFVAAAGNQGFGNAGPLYQSIIFPACIRNAIAVGGLNSNYPSLQPWDITGKGPTSTSQPRLAPDISAPAVVQLHPTDYRISGTSYAAPQVSAAAAMLLQVNPELAPAGVRAALLLGADWTGPVPCTSAQYEQNNTNDPCSYAMQPADWNTAKSAKVLNNIGFGVLNVAESLRYADPLLSHVMPDYLNATGTRMYEFNVTDTSEPVKVILTWMVGSHLSPADLNLEITTPEGSTIDAGSVHQTTEFAVFRPNATGTYTVTVQGSGFGPPDRPVQTFALAGTSSLAPAAPAIDAAGNQSVNVGSTLRLNVTVQNAPAPVRYSIDPLEGAYIHPVTGHLVYVPVEGQQGQQNITVRASDNLFADSTTIQVAVGGPVATVTGIEALPNGTHVATVDVGPGDITGMFAARTHADTTALSDPVTYDAGTDAAQFASDILGSDHPNDDTIYYFAVWPGSSPGSDDGIYARFTPGRDGFEIIPNPGTRPAHYVPDIAAAIQSGLSVTVEPELTDNDGNPVMITGVTDGAEGTARTDGTAITYTLNAVPGTAITDTITYTTTDNAGRQVSRTATITFEPFSINTHNQIAESGQKVMVHSTLRADIEAHNAKGPVTWSVDPLEGARIHPATGHLVYLPPAGSEGPQTLTVRAGDGINNASTDMDLLVTEKRPGGTLVVKPRLNGESLGVVLISGRYGGILAFGIFSDDNYTEPTIRSRISIDGSPQRIPFPVQQKPYTLYFGEFLRTFDTYKVDSNQYLRFVPEQANFNFTLIPIPNPHTRPDPFAPDITISTNATNMPVHVTPELVGMDGGPVKITAVTNGTQGAANHTDTAITYVPETGSGGPDTINYTVTDDRGATSTATVTITDTVTDDRGASSTAKATIILPDIVVATDDNVTATGLDTLTVPVLENDSPAADLVIVNLTSNMAPEHNEQFGNVTHNGMHITYNPGPAVTTLGINGNYTYTVRGADNSTDTADLIITIDPPLATVTVDVASMAPDAVFDITTYTENITGRILAGDKTVYTFAGMAAPDAGAIPASRSVTVKNLKAGTDYTYQFARSADTDYAGDDTVAANFTTKLIMVRDLTEQEMPGVSDRQVAVFNTLRLAATYNAAGDVRYSIDPLEGAYIHPVSGHLVYVPVAGQQGLQNITVRASGSYNTDSITIRVAVGEPAATVTGIEARPDGAHVATVDVGPDDVTGMFAARTHADTTALSDPVTYDAGTDAAQFASDILGSDHPNDDTIYYFAVWPGSSPGSDDGIYARFTPGQNGSEKIIPNPGTRPAHYVPDINTTIQTGRSVTVQPNLTDNDGNPVRITAVTDGTEGRANHTGTTVTYTADADATGYDNITYAVTDNTGLQVNGTIVISLDPPLINPVDDQTVKVHSTLRLNVTVQKAKGPVTWSVDEKEGARIHPVTGHLVYLPPPGSEGPQTLTVRASDGIDRTSMDIDVNVTESMGTVANVELDAGFRHVGDYASNSPTLDVSDKRIFSGGTYTEPGCCRGLNTKFIAGFLPPPEPYTLYFVAIRPNQPGSDIVDSNMYVKLVPGKPGFAIIPNPHTRPDPFAPDIAVSASTTDMPVPVTPELVGMDGGPVNITAVTNGTQGTANHTDTAITYVPETGAGGADTITYTVTDNRGASSTAKATIILPDAPLVARNDNATTTENVTVSIPVLDNDDGNDVTVTVPEQPDHGTARPEDNGTITYMPEPGHNGQVTFMYVISRGAENQTAAVTVTVYEPITFEVPQNPQGAESIAIPELELYTFNITVTNTDNVDHTIGLDPGAPPAAGADITQTGNFTWRPTEAQGPGRYDITIIIDPVPEGAANVTEQITLSVTETNQNPVFDSIDTARNATVGEQFRLDLNATDGDIPAQTITYNITEQNPAENPAAINGTTGIITWTPATTGTRTITVQATDDQMPPGTAGITLAIAAEWMMLAARPDTAKTPEDTPVNINVLGNDTADDVVLEVSMRPVHGNATKEADNTITYVPNPDYNGPDSFAYMITRGNESRTARVNVTITPQDDPVTFNVPPNDGGAELIRINELEPHTFEMAVTNPDEIDYLFDIDAGDPPARGARITPQGSFSWTPDESAGGGTYTVTITLDPVPEGRENVTQMMTFFVNETNQDPVFEAHDTSLMEFTNNTLTYDLNATDADDPPQTVTYAITSQDPSENPAEIDEQTGIITWTPAAAQNRTITVEASDDYTPNGTVQTTLKVSVLDETPLATVTVDVTASPPSATFGVTAYENIVGRILDGNTTVYSFAEIAPQPAGPAHTPTFIQVPRLEPDTNYTYQFARSDDPGYAGDGIIEGTFVTPAPIPAPISLNPTQQQTPSEGDTVDYPIPLRNPDSHAITWTLAPGDLGAMITTDGRFVWTPGEEHGGQTHRFNFTAMAMTNPVNGTISVKVTETNQDPAFDDIDAGQNATVGERFTLDLNATDGDIPGQALTYSIEGQSASTHEAAIDPDNGTISWTPDAPGTKTIRAIVQDGFAQPGSDALDIAVTVTDTTSANTPPTAQNIPETVTAGRSVIIDLSVNNRIGDDQQATDTLAVTISGRPSQGTAHVQNLVINYTAGKTAAGTDMFNYTVTDGQNATANATVTVKINPDPAAGNIADPDSRSTVIAPASNTTIGRILEAYMSRGLVVYAGGPQPGLAGSSGAGFLLAGIIINGTYADSAGPADWNVTDPDDIAVFVREIGNVPPILSGTGDYTINALDTLTFAVSATDFNDTVSYMLSGAPSNATISEQGIFSWMPGPADIDTHTFTITAYDGKGGTNAESVTVRVLPEETPNDSPTAPNVAATVAPGGRVIIIPAISDPDGDRTSITGATGDAGGAIIPSDNDIEYIADSGTTTETITYIVTDSRGATSTGTITITIQ